MLFNSVAFGVFLTIVFLLYYIMPHKYRWGFLLLVSYVFYMNLHLWYGILLFLTTLLTYVLGLFIEKANTSKQKKGILACGILPLILILLFFKTANPVFKSSILLPAGISFYFFQSIGYLVDVYHGKIPSEKHFGYYALFISFFPQLLAGPIGRADTLLPQYKEKRHFDYDRITYGLKLMTWGYFKKLVIADIFAQTVDELYNNVYSYVGLAFIVVTIMFAIEIYCDFSGYSDIAIGCAKLFGIEFTTNFKSPYYSFSIKEFWNRWHISLSTWFRDYVYIPLGGSRCAKWRHYLNLLITFLISGFWHGSSLTFLLWGAFHGFLQIIENLIHPKGKACKKHLWQLILTFALICFTWIFFRANSIQDALWILSRLLWDVERPLNYLKTAVICLNLSYVQVMGMILSVCILGAYDYFSLKCDVIKELSKQKFFIRWPAYVLLLFVITLFSPKGVATEFIYFQF